jgi:hypothetical protein
MSSIQFNKVTWYSKMAALTLFVALPFIGFFLGAKYQNFKTAVQNSPKTNAPMDSANKPTQSSTPINASERTTYTDDNYGFTVNYPASFQAETYTKTYYRFPAKWRMDAFANTDKMPIISIRSFGIVQKDAYPKSFSAEVRIGASRDPQDIAKCFNDDNDSAGISPTTEVINGVTFQKFILGSNEGSNYMTGESYRTVHNGTCYAIEQLQLGSTLRAESSSKDISDDQLDSYYNSLADVVKTFRFTK